MAKTLYRLAQWNCRGGNTKFVEIEHLLNDLAPLSLFLNESHFYSLSSLQSSAYATFRQDRVQSPEDALANGLGGGVALLVKNGTAVLRENRHNYTGGKLSEWIALDIIPESRTAAIRIITGYCPPDKDLDTRWLEGQFDEAARLNMPCFFAGDLNARSPLWGREPWNLRGTTLNNMLNRLDLQVVKSPPTRLQINTGTMSTLDLWVVNDLASSFTSPEVTCGDRLTSDHFSTYVDCEMPTIGYVQPPPTAEEIDRYNIAKANRSAFHKCLRELLEAITVPAAGEPIVNLVRYREDIISCIRQARDRHVPKTARSQISSVAMSPTMRELLAKKRVIERYVRNTYDAQLSRMLQEIDNDFRIARNDHQYQRDIASLRQAETLAAKHRYHEAWLRLQKLDPNRSKKQTGPFRSHDGRVLFPSAELANELLDHFVSPMTTYSAPNAEEEAKRHWQRVEEEIAANIELHPTGGIREPEPGEFTISQRMLANAIARLKSFKAPGLDGLCNIFYKWGGVPLHFHLRRLYNLCLGSKLSIPAWKQAAVVPVPKPGKPTGFITSQRPISLLPTDGKLLESMIAAWMTTFLEARHLLPENQYAFRPHRSAPDIPLRVAQRIFDNRTHHRKTIIVALDVKAAYDSVWHDGLISKLLLLPLPPNLTGWLTDFLRDRKLQARVDGFLSRTVTVNCGVPQGSPLSPLLYILFTADLLATSSANTITESYADDLTTTASGETLSTAEEAAQCEVNRVASWAQLWRQRFNADKSEAMAFGCLPTAVNLDLPGEGHIPQTFTTMRILGVHFDPRLTFRPHVDRVINGCHQNMRWFRRLTNKPGLSRRWRRTAYYALIRSKISYGNTAICSMSKQQRKRLEVVQNNCLRSILNVRLRDRIHISDLQSRCKVPSLPAFFHQCQKRYISNAVKFVLPIRENVEDVRLRKSKKGPAVILAKHLGDDPLPPPSI